MALETNVDRELCVQAADRALAYLRERVLDDTWVAAHRDVAYYFNRLSRDGAPRIVRPGPR